MFLTFRKQPGFFDIVTWDGNPDTGERQIEHSLKSSPGFIIVKQTTGTAKNGNFWHRSFPTSPAGSHMYLNTQGDVVENTVVFGSTLQLLAQFTVGEFSNSDGESYVAYFLHMMIIDLVITQIKILLNVERQQCHQEIGMM